MSVILSACGGGDSGPFDSGSPTVADPPTEPSTFDPTTTPQPGVSEGGAVNGPLAGHLVAVRHFPNRNTLSALDLESGRWTPLEGNPVAGTASFDYFTQSNRQVILEPDNSGAGRMTSTMVELDAQRLPGGVTAVGLHDASGLVDGIFSYEQYARRAALLAKRSRDGGFVAFMLLGNIGIERDMLNVRSSTGEIVSTGDFGAQSNSAYDWLPDGSLLVNVNESFSSGPVTLARTAPYTAREASRITLPSRYDDGDVEEVRVSPDGNQVMLNIELGVRQVPVVLDLRNGGVYQPITPESSPALSAANVSWSPDSQWLVFREERRIYSGPLDPGGANASIPRDTPAVYAVRADGGSYPLPAGVPDSNGNARILLARPADDADGPLHPNHVGYGYLWVE